MLGESGGLKADKFDLQTGGQVLRRGHWHVVTKVNRSVGTVRSVTVLGHFAATIAVEDIADYRAPAEGVAEKVKVATKLAPMCNYPGEGLAMRRIDSASRLKRSSMALVRPLGCRTLSATRLAVLRLSAS